MLSALLPGVREFRTPLVTGVLWAACFWLLVGLPASNSSATRSFVERFDLADLPPTVWFATAALAIYLVGSLLVVRGSPLIRFSEPIRSRFADRVARLDEDREPYRRRYRGVWRLWHKYRWHRLMRPLLRVTGWAASTGERFEPVDGWLYNEFQSLTADGRVPVMRSFDGGCSAPNGFEAFYATDTLHSHPAFADRSDEIRSYLGDAFVHEVKAEKAAVEVRIQMRYPDVYAEIDRLKVEAELRMSIFWPLVLLLVLLSFVWSPLVLLGLLIPPWLLRNGFQRAQEASDKTWSALVAGEVSSPILDAMESAKNGECRDFAARYDNRAA